MINKNDKHKSKWFRIIESYCGFCKTPCSKYLKKIKTQLYNNYIARQRIKVFPGQVYTVIQNPFEPIPTAEVWKIFYKT